MRSLKLLGPAEVNLCGAGPHSPTRLCRADEAREAASAREEGETSLPLWPQMKNLLLVFSKPLLLFRCELKRCYSPMGRLLKGR